MLKVQFLVEAFMVKRDWFHKRISKAVFKAKYSKYLLLVSEFVVHVSGLEAKLLLKLKYFLVEIASMWCLILLLCLFSLASVGCDGVQFGDEPASQADNDKGELIRQCKRECDCGCEKCRDGNCCREVSEGGYPCCTDCDCTDFNWQNFDAASINKRPIQFASALKFGNMLDDDLFDCEAYNFDVSTFDDTPVVNLPPSSRQRNWGGGSCVFATTVMQFTWVGQDQAADYIRSNYSGGAWPDRLNKALDSIGAKYAYVTNGNVSFLEWACRTRRGAGIQYFGAHYVLLVHLDSEKAGILDNNHTGYIIWIDRDVFEKTWKNKYGWATVLLYDPPPPLPGEPDLSDKQVKPYF